MIEKNVINGMGITEIINNIYIYIFNNTYYDSNVIVIKTHACKYNIVWKGWRKSADHWCWKFYIEKSFKNCFQMFSIVWPAIILIPDSFLLYMCILILVLGPIKVHKQNIPGRDDVQASFDVVAVEQSIPIQKAF